ncbi:MAG: ComEC/Rec2 family competence protein [Sphingobacteriaceae bacterium]
MFYKGEIPFVRFVLPFISGILIAWYYPDFITHSILLALIALLFGFLVIGVVVYKRFKIYAFRWLFGLIIHALLFLCALERTLQMTPAYQENHFSKTPAKILVIKVASEPTIRGDIARFEAEVCYAGQKRTTGKLLIALKLNSRTGNALNYGDLFLIPAVYHEVEPPYNPSEFDFKNYLRARQINHQCFINMQQIRLLGSGYGNSVINFAIRLRQKIVQRFKKYIPNPEAAAMASTLIMGYRADLSPEILSAFSKTGTMHVLSVSGMHVALVFIMLSFMLRPLDKYPPTRFLKVIIIIALIWFYALITGFSPSVNRAALMLSFVVLGKALNKGMNTYNLLAISAFILLLFYPFYLFDIGFQLSYLAVLGLVFLHPHLYSLCYVKWKIFDAVWSYSSLSIAAQFITFPLSLYIFHQFPLYFLLSNLLIVIPITLMMYAGLSFVLLSAFSTFSNAAIGMLLNYTIYYTNKALYFIEKLPYSSLQGVFIDAKELCLLYFFSIGIVFACVFKNKSCWHLALLAALGFFSFTSNDQIQDKKRRQLIFYSLRKDMAISYIHGSEIILISNLNPSDKAYQFSVQPSLNRAGLQLKRILKPDETFYSEWLSTDGHWLQIGKLRILKWDARFNFKTLIKPFRADILLLSGNPRITIQQLSQWVKTPLILIDGTNPDYKIGHWVAQAKALQIACKVLKKSPAITLQL